jgi:CheY-like chemotaxis protein
VIEAMSAEEALSVLTANPKFDLVITDIRMQGEAEGLTLANCIRRIIPGLKVAIASVNVDLLDEDYDVVSRNHMRCRCSSRSFGKCLLCQRRSRLRAWSAGYSWGYGESVYC